MKKRLGSFVIIVALLFSFAWQEKGCITVKAASYTAAREYDGIGADKIGNCVFFARYKVPSLPGGLNTLQDKINIINSHTAAPGSIAITRGNSSAGHVAYVESVSGANVVTLNGGFSGSGLSGHIVRITGTESEQGILGYWYPANLNNGSTGNNPQGCFDGTEGGEHSVRVHGWAFDKDNTGAGLDIHVYIGGPAGSGAEGHVIKANKERKDVNAAYGTGNYHGFDDTIMTERTGTQEVYIYAINVGGGSENPCLGHKSVTIKSDLVGCLDFLEGKTGAVWVRGWAFDSDTAGSAVEIHVYIGGPAGSGAEKHIIKANKERADVHTAYGTGKYHGIDEMVQTSKTGNQNVYLYVINTGSGGNWELGHKTVSIAKAIIPTSTPRPTVKPIARPAVQPTKKPGLQPTVKSTVSPVKKSTKTGNHSHYTKVKIERPAKMKVHSVRGGKKKLTVNWTWDGQDGFQLQCATNRRFTKNKKSCTVKGVRESKTFKKLKSGRTYYVRMRAYNSYSGTKYYGKWSKVKKVKIKK